MYIGSGAADMFSNINGEGGHALTRSPHDRKTNVAKHIFERLGGCDTEMIEVVDGQLR